MEIYYKQKLTYYNWMNKNKRSNKEVFYFILFYFILFYVMLVVHGFCLSWLLNASPESGHPYYIVWDADSVVRRTTSK